MPTGSSGLSLIEVLLAVSILGMGFAVLLTAGVRCLSVMKAAQNYQEAQWVLGAGEAEYPLVIVDDIDDLNVERETFDNGFTFEREVEEEDEEEDGLYKVWTRVTWYGRGHEHVEEVVRYIYYPEDEE